jgi:hypothetical protein
MAVKVKELKDDAIVDVKVNKNYYLMMKATLFHLFQSIQDDKVREESLKNVMAADYQKMNDWERAFFSITLFLTEVEKQATANNLYDEKEVLEPGDEGYVEPTMPD